MMHYIFNFYYSLEKKISTIIKSCPRLHRILVLFLDFGTRLIGIIFTNRIIYGLFCLSLIVFPIYYYPEVYAYMKQLYQVGFSIGNIFSAVTTLFPLPFVILIFLFVFVFFIVIAITPLLFITALTEELQQKYGKNILKERGCNGKLTPLVKFSGTVACLICGEIITGNVIAHSITTDAWKEVALANPNVPVNPPQFKGPFDQSIDGIASIVDAIRRKK